MLEHLSTISLVISRDLSDAIGGRPRRPRHQMFSLIALTAVAAGRTPVIIIADPGVDDAGALLLALAQPTLDILGVVASFGGHNDPKYTARNAQALIDAAGRSADVPVIVGAHWPLGMGNSLQVSGSMFHGPDGLGGLLGPLQAVDEDLSKCRANETSAAEFIANAARRLPQQIFLLCFSPLTNVADALSIEPNLPALLKGFYLMGGATHGIGNASPLGEANFVHDAYAARAVVAAWGAAGASACDLVLAPLDVTHQAAVSQKRVDEWAAAAKGKARLFAESWPWYAGAYCERSGECESMPFHDAHPVAYLLLPELYTRVETMRVEVLASAPGRPEHGMSLVDKRAGALRRAAAEPPGPAECDAKVLMEVDEEGFLALNAAAFARLGRGEHLMDYYPS